LESFHEVLGSRSGDGSQVVDELLLGHTDSGINDGQGVGVFVWDDLDLEVWVRLRTKFLWLSDGLVSDFVQSIRGIGDQLSQEDILVGIEGVDDESHQLVNVCVESKLLCLACHL
jgi:hypothetical protein